MRRFLLTLLWVSGLTMAVMAEGGRPNVIVMMADDMGFSDLGCYGGEIDTPNLDRMAAGGMMFTQFYNNAKCTTTRATLLSGMDPRGSGSSIPLEMPTLGEAMQALGYATALCGKWHLGSSEPQRPQDRGFEVFYGLMDGCCNFFDPARPDPPFKGGKVRAYGDNNGLITEFPEGFYTTDAFTDKAIAAVKAFSAADRPFVMHLAYTAPHYPLHAPVQDIAKYRGRYRDGWEALRRARYERQLTAGLFDPAPALSETDSEAYHWAEADQEWEDLRMATYAAMVDRLDQNIGRLLLALEEAGVAGNTLVLFFSDNGGCAEEPGGRDATQQPGVEETYTAVGPAWGWAQNTPFRRYKSWLNEGGIATPMIAYWPGKIEAGSRSNHVTHIVDVMPTCLELAGVDAVPAVAGKKRRPLEGQSLLPILFQADARSVREGDLCWEWSGNAAIRRGDWKLVWDKLEAKAGWQLFDLSCDRSEMNNVAETHPGLVAELVTAYEAWAKRTQRKIPGGGK